MTKRSPSSVFMLSVITLGIYGIFWRVNTKREMCRLGADIPTSWYLIVPFANIYWSWKYARGVEFVSQDSMSKEQAAFFIFLPLIVTIVVSVLKAYLIMESRVAPWWINLIYLFTDAFSCSMLQSVFNDVEKKSLFEHNLE